MPTPACTLAPMTDEAIRADYGARAAEYTELLGSVEDMHELDRRLIERWSSGIRGPVLDAGCGPGHWTDFLHRQGADVSGVDLVPEFIDSARLRFPNVPFRVSSLRALDVTDGSLGGVLAWYSLIHLTPAELPLVLAELHRVLKPQGHLLIGVFEGESARPFDHAVTRAYYWSIDRMTRMLEGAGFEVFEAETRHDPGNRPHAAIDAVAGRRCAAK